MELIYTNFHQGWGGQALQVLQLAGAMRKRGHNVTVFCPPKSDLAARAEADKLSVNTDCHFPRGFRPRRIASDCRALRAVAADVIHCHGSQDTWIAATAMMGRRRNCSLVRTKHNSYPAKRHAANRWLYNRGLDHLIAVADPIRDELVSDGFVNPERVSVIPAGLADNFAAQVSRSREDVRSEFNIAPDAPLIGLVGRLAPDKGQDTLLQAAAKLRDELPGARYLLIGTGGDWDRIRNLIDEMNLKETVIWAGFRDDVADLTAALDISLLAAKACDASSTVVKEALALGVPVVATDVGGTSELIDHGSCGRLIQPDDADELAGAIRATLTETDETARRVAAGLEHVPRYFASAVAEATEAVYQTLLDQHGGTTPSATS